MRLLAKLVMSVLVAFSAARSWTINRYPSFVLQRVPRGGGGSEYTAVGVIPGPLDTTSAPFVLQKALEHKDACSLIIMVGDSPKRIALPKDSDMMKTLSMTCNVLVCTTPFPIKSILEGAIRRDLAGYSKLKLIVILPPDVSGETREQLVLHDLKAFTPEHFDALELVTIDEISSVWNDLVVENDNDQVMIEEKGLIPLVKAIYVSLSNKPCNIHLEEETTHLPTAKQDLQSHVEIAQLVLSQAQARLDILETKLDDVWLNSDSVPMLEFGTEADVILQQASDTLRTWVPPVNTDVRNDILVHISADLKRLYDQQLQLLREHYGRRYESVLDSVADPAEWTQEAVRVTEAFRAAAQHAIPQLCQEGGELADADFSYVLSLQRLITDMMEAMSSREDLNAAAASDEGDDDGTSEPRIVKWYEKLAARAAVLGINYLQGWMAWQAIQRAALERDRDMPKFPLF